MNLLEKYEILNNNEIYEAPEEIGTPEEDEAFSPGKQERPDTCAIRAQQHILSMYGIETTETELLEKAIEEGEYGMFHRGTYGWDIGNHLVRYGIPINRYDDATMAHLISELGQGHKVIVGVDAYELDVDTPAKKYNQIARDMMRETGNHVIVVTGVDPETLEVSFVNPADGKAHVLSAENFLDAWGDSNNLLISTKISPEEFLREERYEGIPARVEEGYGGPPARMKGVQAGVIDERWATECRPRNRVGSTLAKTEGYGSTPA